MRAVSRAPVPKHAARRLLGVLGLIGGLGAAQTAQQPAPRIGAIAGHVVDAAGRPVSAAVVSIEGSGVSNTAANRAPRILTGADGRFVFSQLPVPGSFSVTVTKGGYAEGAYGRHRPNGSSQSIALTEGQKAAEIVVRVWKLGVIAGTVTDEAGEPVVSVQVRALMRRAGAARQFGGAVAAAMTDDRGVYRLGSLLPGEYIITASQPGISAPVSVFTDAARGGKAPSELAALATSMSTLGVRVGDALYGAAQGTVTPPPPSGIRMRIYPPTFHPAALTPSQAAVVSVASGEERTSVDVHLTPVSTLRVSGTLMGPSGPAGMVPLRLVPGGGDLVPAEALGSIGVTDASGAFIFPAVVPGHYVLKTYGRESPGLAWLSMPIAVSGDDVQGIVATLQPALRVTARPQFEGNAPPPSAPQTGRVAPFFTLEADEAGPPFAPGPGDTSADGLTLTGYPPGRYRVRVNNSPPGWMFKAALLDGVDVSLTSFDFSRDVSDLTLVFTDRWSGAGGVVQGTRADRAVVVLFPTDSRAWLNAGPNPRRLRSVRVDAEGRFAIRSVPPGDYYVVAIPDEQAADWRDPSMLETLARIATQLAVLEGDYKTLDLQMREVRQ
jgi:hypothetical protein